MVPKTPGTIVIYADLACPWAHLAVHRLWDARQRLGASVVFDHHPFPLEVVNGRPTPKRVLDAEIPVTGALAPAAGWELWQRPPWEWPVTSLPALEAVQAAKEQGPAASEALDRALRRAFFGESRCISMRHVVLDVAAEVDGVDEAALRDALDSGRCRAAVLAPPPDEVQGSPHLFLPDGSDVPNPGVEMHWVGDHGVGFPVVDRDDPSVYEDIIRRATP